MKKMRCALCYAALAVCFALLLAVGVGTGSAVMQLVTMVLAGLTTGATVVIGRHIGERRPEAAGRTVGAAVALFALFYPAITGVVCSRGYIKMLEWLPSWTFLGY